MSADKAIKIYPFLYPLSWLYGLGVWIRNKLFDWGILPTECYPLPVICIGNLTVGGTGKTPHTEYLINYLSQYYRVAVVSRGYKRKTQGFILASAENTCEEIGDEPFQMKRKFPSIQLAVDSDRRRAIRTLLAQPEDNRPEIILLDDAFQHRYVTPSLSILLIDFNRRISRDALLPAGRLREFASASSRAHIFIITKCPRDILQAEDYATIRNEIGPTHYQRMFFTGIVYDELTPVFGNTSMQKHPLEIIKKGHEIVLVSGIANPAPLIEEIERRAGKVVVMNFPDHYLFKDKDIEQIKNEFDKLTSPEKMIIVTEKDAVRLINNEAINEEWKPYFYYLPITIDFQEHPENFPRNQEDVFQEALIKHILSVER